MCKRLWDCSCVSTALCYVFVVCLAACVVQAQRIPEENRPTRTIYIGAVEVDWDYAPEGNQLGPGADE